MASILLEGLTYVLFFKFGSSCHCETIASNTSEQGRRYLVLHEEIKLPKVENREILPTSDAVQKAAVTAGARSPRPSASTDSREGLPQTTRMRGAIVKAKGELLHNITMEPEEKGEAKGKFPQCNEIARGECIIKVPAESDLIRTFTSLFLHLCFWLVMTRFVVFCVTSLRKCSGCLKRHRWLLAVVTAAISLALFLENDTKMQNWRGIVETQREQINVLVLKNTNATTELEEKKKVFNTLDIKFERLNASLQTCADQRKECTCMVDELQEKHEKDRQIKKTLQREMEAMSNATMTTSADNEKCKKCFAELNETLHNVSDMISKLNIDLENCKNTKIQLHEQMVKKDSDHVSQILKNDEVLRKVNEDLNNCKQKDSDLKKCTNTKSQLNEQMLKKDSDHISQISQKDEVLIKVTKDLNNCKQKDSDLKKCTNTKSQLNEQMLKKDSDHVSQISQKDEEISQLKIIILLLSCIVIIALCCICNSNNTTTESTRMTTAQSSHRHH